MDRGAGLRARYVRIRPAPAIATTRERQSGQSKWCPGTCPAERPALGVARTDSRLSRAAEERLFDRAARHYLGMSGQDFLRKWRAGEFKNPNADPAVRHVAMLAPVG